MKRITSVSVILLVVFTIFLLLTSSSKKMADARVKKPVIEIENEPNLEIHEGYLSQKEEKVLVRHKNKTVATIKLGEPQMIAMAEKKERWGYFQFPSIGRSTDGELRITWQMAEDSHKAYGKGPQKEFSPLWSADNGKTWKAQIKTADVRSHGYNVQLSDSSFLQIYIPKSKEIGSYKRFPKSVGKKDDYTFYKEEELPDELRGVYFSYTNKEGKSEIIHSKLIDPGLLRYASDGLMPVVWWGNIKQTANGTLVAGIYPAYYLDEYGQVSDCGVSFYTSEDKGNTWEITGKILFQKDGIAEILGSGCYEEPAFELLGDGSFICVMRSGSASPMYKCFSNDGGKTWTTPEPFTANGVKPELMLLENGVLLLTSGRPGVQLRFSLDGSGREWTEPIDMVPLIYNTNLYKRDVSCGYTSILESGTDTFLMVYSDFTKKNEAGQERKSIWFRKVSIKNRN